MAAPQASSRLEMLQARFQQRQLLEKEQKLMQLYDQQQLRAHQVAQRGSAGSNGSNSSGNGTSSTVSHHQTVTRTTTNTHSTGNSQPGGKVRQMFDERRQTTVKGIDKSYPLEPLDNRARKQQSTTTTSNVVVSSTSPLKNGNPMSNRQSLVMRRTVRSEANSNVNGGKPIVSYHEEVSRESCGPPERDNELEEFGDDDNQQSRYANGNQHVDQRSEVHIEDVTNENTSQRHRTTTKILLSEFDSSNETSRVGDNVENEQFPEELVTIAPDRLPRRGPVPRKVSQAEARLERFKNSNTKRPGQPTKQVAGNATSFTKKRTETSVHSGSTSRASTVTRTAEEEASTRARSTTPEVERTGRPRSPTPEERSRKLTSPVVDRTSIATKASGITKVSQLTHKSSVDFYPRRKSEFEKSRTFRKLQLELGESSPEPEEQELLTACAKQCRKRSSILDENIYSPGGRSSSSSPSADRDASRTRRDSRDKSPEYSQPRGGSESPVSGRRLSETREETRTSTVQSHTCSSRRRSSSSSVTAADRDTIRGRRTSREMSPERPGSRRGSESPIYERTSTTKSEETKTTDGGRRSTSVESNFYSSTRRSSSTRPSVDGTPSKGRKVSREKSWERPQSRKRSESPAYVRKSGLKSEKTRRTSIGTKTTGRESHVYSSGRRSTSSSPSGPRDPQKGRRDSRETSPEYPRSRKGSESPIYERKSTVKREETKTTDGRRHSTSVESNFYSSRRRSSSTRPAVDANPSKERKFSRERSPERPQSRKGSVSPVYERKSAATSEETKITTAGIRRTEQESNIYSSGRRSSSSSPVAAHDPEKGRRSSREMSPERPQSRRGSASPVYRRRSTVSTEETLTTRAASKATSTERKVTSEESTVRRETPICVRMTRKRSESPRREFRGASTDRQEAKADGRRTSGETLRSFELVKKLARPGSDERKTTGSTRRSMERKTTLEDVELLGSGSRRRSESPPHKVVKKDKVVMDISRDDRSKAKDTGRRNSNDTKERTVRPRSRTTSPSPPPSSTMKETASFRAKKAERKNSSETRRIESKHHQHEEKKVVEINKTNLSHEKARNCDLSNVIRSPSPIDDDRDRSRRSSAEITVKRHETFRVSKPSQRVVKIERESSVDEDSELPICKPIKADVQDKSQLLERIEKIRTTLLKSGRSEQNLQESKDFERTDSVESALRRFDSIGAETEHRVTVGVDEIDRSVASQSPEPVHRTTNEIVIRKEKIARKSVESRNKPGKIAVAVIKVQPKGINAKNRDSSKEKSVRVNLNQKILETTKSVKAKKEKSVTAATPRQSAKPRASQKIATSLVQRSKLRSEESSGRGEGRAGDRSPECKRRLFDDSEEEIEADKSRSTVVLSTITRVTKGPGLVEIETRNDRDDRKIGNESTMRSESSLREMRTESEQPAKVLRSIEDIRKSIKRETQDFKRELNKFNTAMRKDEESSSTTASPDTTVTSGMISCVKITKTLKPGDVEPVVKIERSTVKLPITRRIAKSPSPDIGTKRSTEGRARTPTASVRRSAPSSPTKSPDATARYGSPKPLARTSPSRTEVSRTTEYSDCTDGPGEHSEFTVTESSVSATTTKRNDAFVIEFDDDEVPRSKESSTLSQGKPPLRKQSTEKSLIQSQKQQSSPTTTPLPRPASALSTSSTGSARGQSSQINSKSRMSTKAKSPSSSGPKGPPGSARGSTAAAANDGLAPCKICGRRFNSDRITLHEQICSKTATKKRKQFDATIHRVRGTELEQFVVKKGGAKKAQADRKASKPEVKSNWRRKHEDFINAIRSAKQVQAHLAAGGKLSDLPPPPASDTSDYIQCPHCGRKFNQSAAERHIPKCQNMMHNKPNPRAPPKPKR